MITRRLPGMPASHACCASSMPSWPDVAVAGEADDVRGHFAARVEAAIFVLVVQALDAQRHRALGDFRRDLLRDEREVVVGVEPAR